MKKTTILFSLLALSGSVIGQQAKQAVPMHSGATGSAVESKSSAAKGIRALSVAPFYSEDFANGIPAGWSNAGSPAAALWEYRPDTVGIKGSRGAYASPATTGFIKSPTNYNGYVIFDSDYLDNGGTAGAFGTGAAPAPHKSTLKTASINCSTHAAVILQFNNYKRYFAGVTTVTVDNGVTKNTYTVNGSLAVNSSSSKSDVVVLNITPDAGGKSNVTLSFTFDGTVGNAGSQGYYFWMIDDIKLIDAPANDLVLEDDGLTFGDKSGGKRAKYGYYTKTPGFHQVDSLGFDGEVFNNGANDQHNVKLNANITFNGGSIFNKDYAYPKGAVFPALKSGVSISSARDTVITPREMIPSIHTCGTYTLKLSVKSDEVDGDTTNNSRTHTFATTDTTFARDNNFISSTVGNDSYTTSGSNLDGFKIADLYEMNMNDKVSSITIYLAKGTTIGSKLKGQLFKADLKTLLTETPDYIVAAKDTGGKFVTLPYYADGTIENVQKDSVYYAAAYTYAPAVAGQKVRFADDNSFPQPSQVGLLYLPGGTANPANWYSNGNAYLVRLNTVHRNPCLVAVNEAKHDQFTVGQNIPNPFSRTSVINYTLDKSSVVALQVFDVTGRLVLELNEGVKSAGSFSFTLDASKFNKGIYFYTVKAGENSVTKKMVISE